MYFESFWIIYKLLSILTEEKHYIVYIQYWVCLFYVADFLVFVNSLSYECPWECEIVSLSKWVLWFLFVLFVVGFFRFFVSYSFGFECDLLPKSGMASLVCVITLRINKDNTVWDTNIVTPVKKNITQKRRKWW